MIKSVVIFLGLTIFSASLAILYLCMRAVMVVGGACAEGGAYVIQTQCPGGVDYLFPLSFFTIFIGAFVYCVGLIKNKNSPNWAMFFWSAIFITLGWNFLDFGLHSTLGSEATIAWLVCTAIFIVMGIIPLIIMALSKTVIQFLQKWISHATKHPRWQVSASSQPAVDPVPALVSKGEKMITWVIHWMSLKKSLFGQSIPLFLLHMVALGLGIYLGITFFLNS